MIRQPRKLRVRKPILFYLFPKDAYYVPSAARVGQLLEAMDQTLELGLRAGATFWGVLRENPPEPDKPGDPPPGEGQAFEASNYDEFRERAENLNGLEEIQIKLGPPGREPLVELGVGTAKTERIEVRGYKRLRMVGLGDLKDARQVCPSCGEGQPLGNSHPARPDPRYDCSCAEASRLYPTLDFRWAGPSRNPFPSPFPATVSRSIFMAWRIRMSRVDQPGQRKKSRELLPYPAVGFRTWRPSRPRSAAGCERCW